MYMSPSFEATALIAAPYRGKGFACGDEKFRRRCDHGYRDAPGLEFGELLPGVGW
jgi:hypothetical protein